MSTPYRGSGYGHRSSDYGRQDYNDNRLGRERYQDSPSSYARRSSPHDQSYHDNRGYGNSYNNTNSSDYHNEGNYRRRASPQYSRSNYRDRDNQNYRSPRRSSRSRSKTRSRSPGPRRRERQNPPSREVMFEGLTPDITEKDIRATLETQYQVSGLTDVRILRDRKDGSSRQFGYLRFADLKTSTTFMDNNAPAFQVRNHSNEQIQVSIHFSREKDDRNHHVAELDWCTTSNFARRAECYKCQASKAYYSAGPPIKPPHVNVGDSDVSPDSTPSQFLLLRGLGTSVTEDLLAKGVAKLYKSPGENAVDDQTTKKGSTKISSTTASSNFGAQEGTIRRVFMVRDRDTKDSWRFGFAEFHSVEDAQAALNKFHSLDKFTIASNAVLASYIHAGVFVPSYGATEEDEQFSFSASFNPSIRLAYWDQKGFAQELIINVEAPQRPQDDNSVPATGSATAISADKVLKNVTDPDGKQKKRKAESSNPIANKKAMPSHLQFWKNRHDELHGGNKPSESDDNQVETQSYADPNKNCCYLCSRQFKTTAEVNKHERLSQLHRDNLKNDELKTKALAKLSKAGIIVPSTTEGPESEDTNEYRDRAKERRAVYKQPKQPKSQPKNAQLALEPEEVTSKAPSKGASLLGKMGWTAGQGLGASGSGMTAPIATDVYAQGVGLGAAGGKLGDAVEEAERQTKGGYQAFLEKTREQARGRYEQMKE